MKRLFVFVLVFAFCLGTAAMLRSLTRQGTSVTTNRSTGDTTSGPFRDGLYLGELAAARGSAPHIAFGRWAADKDRASFTKGYQQGYDESLAIRASAGHGLRRSE